MVVALYIDNKTFVISMLALKELKIISIYFLCKAQVILLINLKISTFLMFFFSDSIVDLPKYIRINNHFID